MNVIPKDRILETLSDYESALVGALTNRQKADDLNEVNFQKGKIYAYRELANWIHTNYGDSSSQ